MKPLVTVLEGVAQVVHGEVEIVDWDDWNDRDATDATRQEIIERIQHAGYRAIVHEDDVGDPAIRIFLPHEPYEHFITEDVHGPFAVYDPLEA